MKEELLEKEWQLRMDFDTVFNVHEQLIGIDEVGRGPLAGPVVAAAVMLPHHAKLLGLKDSKKISEKKRERLYDEIYQTALAIGIGIVEAPDIDKINILQATFEAMRQALSQIPLNETYSLLVDGNQSIPKIEQQQYTIIGGDNKSACIAAASVIAKVTRDRMMIDYAKDYPYYDWEHNKGYGTKKHYEGISAYGITPLHRHSFLKKFYETV